MSCASAPRARFSIDDDKVKSEARDDGKWVLCTNTELCAKEAALKYKHLWMVEGLARFELRARLRCTNPWTRHRTFLLGSDNFCRSGI